MRATQVDHLLESQGIEQAVLVGHSIGGKVAMATALQHPERVERLLVLDIAPVSYEPSEPQWEAIDKVVAAMRSINLATVRSKRDADQLLSRSVQDAGLRAFVLLNLVRGGSGADGADGFRWRVNLPAIEASLPRLAAWDMAPGTEYGGNTLFVAGDKSRFLRSSHLPAIQEHFSRFSLSTIRSADHWIHADEPEALLLIATNFLAVPNASP